MADLAAKRSRLILNDRQLVEICLPVMLLAMALHDRKRNAETSAEDKILIERLSHNVHTCMDDWLLGLSLQEQRKILERIKKVAVELYKGIKTSRAGPLVLMIRLAQLMLDDKTWYFEPDGRFERVYRDVVDSYFDTPEREAEIDEAWPRVCEVAPILYQKLKDQGLYRTESKGRVLLAADAMGAVL